MTIASSSYTSASTFPWKLVRLAGEFVQGLRPIHLQLCPTNRCNAKCSWCSCRKVDRSLELPESELLAIIRRFATMGTRAVTVTGGGEPTLHRGLRSLTETANGLGLSVGLVTNGIAWGRPEPIDLRWATFKWLRASIPGGTIAAEATTRVQRILDRLPSTVDVGVSLTIGDTTDPGMVDALSELAERTLITHVRLVQEIVELPSVDLARYRGRPKVIVQERDHYKPGAKRCLTSLVKPIVAADGYAYPCCGVQYARGADLMMPKEFRMCHWRDFPASGSLLGAFDGSVCSRCYYGGYNEVLAVLVDSMEHEEFV